MHEAKYRTYILSECIIFEQYILFTVFCQLNPKPKQHWKAQNLIFYSMVSDLTFAFAPGPIIGQITVH